MDEILRQALLDTFLLLKQVLPPMAIGLFGIEFLMQLGLMQKLEPLGKPLVRASRLPPQSVLAFFTAIGSLVAANVMLVRHYEERTITGRELQLGAVFNTVPLHFKETLTYQLPVILPLLGIRLCLIYVATFWLSGFLKLGYVILQGRRVLPKRSGSEDNVSSDDGSARRKRDPIILLVKKTFQSRWRLFAKMVIILLTVTFVVQLLVHGGVLSTVGRLVAPAADLLRLPHQIIAPVSVYIFSPIVGITAMSPLLKQQVITEYQAIVALLAAGFLMIPVLRLRGTLPRYVSIFGWKHGVSIISITTVLSLVARAIILVWVIFFFT